MKPPLLLLLLLLSQARTLRVLFPTLPVYCMERRDHEDRDSAAVCDASRSFPFPSHSCPFLPVRSAIDIHSKHMRLTSLGWRCSHLYTCTASMHKVHATANNPFNVCTTMRAWWTRLFRYNVQVRARVRSNVRFSQILHCALFNRCHLFVCTAPASFFLTQLLFLYNIFRIRRDGTSLPGRHSNGQFAVS